jgi:hypothetical protein
VASVSEWASCRPAWLGGGDWWVPLAEVHALVGRLSELLLGLARLCADPRLPDGLLVVGFECSRALGEAAGELARLDVHPWPDLLRAADLGGGEDFGVLLGELAGSAEEAELDRAAWRAAVERGFGRLDEALTGLAAADLPGQRNLAAWARALGAELRMWRASFAVHEGGSANLADR